MTDWGGVAQVITSVGGLLAAVFSGIAMVRSSQARKSGEKAEKQSAETHIAVNSRMDEFKKLFESVFLMKGKMEERDAQARDTSGPAMIVVAEAKAQALIAEATAAAAKLLAEAHHVSVTNLSDQPVPVKVVGPGVDTPLKVTPLKAPRKRKKV